MSPSLYMIPAMKTLTIVVCAPLLAALAVLPAQDKKQGPKSQDTESQDTKTQDTKAQAPKNQDTKATKADIGIKALDNFIAKKEVDTKKAGWRQSLSQPPTLAFNKNAEYFWHVETAVGSMKIRYFADTAPKHVSSGIYLSRLGFYDGLNFHRIIPGFMAQGGCPTGSGKGNPGYFMAGEFKGKRKHDKAGILSTANTGRPKSEGSQFFLTFGPTAQLDGKYTIWGEVVEGQATLQALAKLGSRANNGVLKDGPKIVRSWVEVVTKPGKPADGNDNDNKTPAKKVKIRELSEGKG